MYDDFLAARKQGMTAVTVVYGLHPAFTNN